MEEGKRDPLSDKSLRDHHVPPPTDPYVTYQTPYPRRPSEEVQNPFIEFRRLADSAFSSLFSGLPRVLGTEKFKEANIKESDQEFVKAFDQQAKEFENRIAEMVRARAEEAEGFRKKLEQEWEERRRDNEKRMEEENQRWEMMRRGLERCPGLKPDGVEAGREAETELDLYDGLRAYEAAAYKPKAEAEKTETRKCPWKDEEIDKKCPWNEKEQIPRNWLSGMGFDGRRRAKNIPLYVQKDHMTEQARENNAEWRKYTDEEMDPFTNDDHVVPWLRLSPYSPLTLIENQSLSEMPWDEAFEDLMSVHKTGKLPSLVRRLVYWGGPNQWMTDMALRGSLGPKWEEGFMIAALMGTVGGNQWRGFDALKAQCVQLAGREFRNTTSQLPSHDNFDEEGEDDINENDDNDGDDADFDPEDWVDVLRGAFEPKVRETYEQMEELAEALLGRRHSPERAFGAHGMLWPSPEEVLNALSEGQLRVEKEEASDNKQSREIVVASPNARDPRSSTSTQTSSWSTTDAKTPESLVSTLTTTTTRTLPDGSVETKKVLKKRFADGREENSESTELKPFVPPVNARTQTMADEKIRENVTKSGWFWN